MAEAAKPTAAMQAVIVIHGMGEQRPMDTIKGFVRAVWETDDEITKNGLPKPHPGLEQARRAHRLSRTATHHHARDDSRG